MKLSDNSDPAAQSRRWTTAALSVPGALLCCGVALWDTNGAEPVDRAALVIDTSQDNVAQAAWRAVAAASITTPQLREPATVGAIPQSDEGAIEGAILDGRGNGIADIPIRLPPDRDSVAHTDADGKFRIVGLNSYELYTLVFEPANSSMGLMLTRIPGNAKDVTFRLGATWHFIGDPALVELAEAFR
jgi:hypothetical protein